LYYENFIHHYPNVVSLANASDAAVFKLWEGLGYYSRCRNLLITAREIGFNRAGKFPETSTELKKLKGIGEYTAAAIASFAYNEPVAVVDGNVQRVLSRYFNINAPIDTAAGKKVFSELAQSLLHSSNPAIYNQAVMDFGATVCLPQKPLCVECIFQKSCAAYKLGVEKQLPVKLKKIIKKERWFTYFIASYKNEVLIRKRIEKDIWQNLHEFVLFESKPKHSKQKETAFLNSLFANHFNQLPEVATYRQQLTHVTVYGRFVKLRLHKKIAPPGYYYEKLENLRKNAFPGLINTYLTEESTQKLHIPKN
jgi:A/G-specific adenine glycosylase